MSLTSGKNDITFKSQGLNLAPLFYIPCGFKGELVTPVIQAIDNFFNKHGGPTAA